MTDEQLYELAERLAPLAGMAYHGCTKTADQWEQITGTNPRQFPTCIQVHRSGMCSMLPRGLEILTQHCRELRNAAQSRADSRQ